ncbi:MAG: HAD-IA family hydrolase [Acidobacteria bacterium]|nr:HAD-IA family hydrolase [Acidobacteriota bacterium]
MPTFFPSAILFDLDGVLVDSTRSVVRQWGIWAREHHIDPDRFAEIGHGVRSIEVVRQLAPHLDAAEEVRRLEAREAADQEGVTVMPGAPELLRSIPEGRWCVVTSGTRHLALARLAIGRLPVPQVMVTADDVVNGKPHPEPYLKGAALLGADPKECLVMEDAPAGIQAAQAGGMKAVGLTSTYAAAELSPADAVIQRLAQIALSVDGAQKLKVEIRPA